RGAPVPHLPPRHPRRRLDLPAPPRRARGARRRHARRVALADPPPLGRLPHLRRRRALLPHVNPVSRFCLFGGVYNNHLALAALSEHPAARGATRFLCLGDLGGFGPSPNKVLPLLLDHDVTVLQGNYDHSVGYGLSDCGCGYTDPRDNHYAQLSY